MRKRWEEAFLDGYKPAVLQLTTHPTYEQLKKYPNCLYGSWEPTSRIFFQTQQQLDTYRELMKDVREDSPEFHRIVGLTLGFPRRSVEHFAWMRELEERTGQWPEEEEKKTVGAVWAGFYFSCLLDIADHEIQWLWDTYQHPKADGHPVYFWTPETSYIEIPYGDLDELHRVQDMLIDKIAVRG